MKTHRGMKCWASILILAFSTARMAELSAVRASRTIPPEKVIGTHFCYKLSGPQSYWMRKERNGSLENFQGPSPGIGPGTPACRRSSSTNCAPLAFTSANRAFVNAFKLSTELKLVLPDQCVEYKPLRYWELKSIHNNNNNNNNN